MKWLHNLLLGCSLTGALFVFQACYGSPQDSLHFDSGEASLTFSVVSVETGEPVGDVRILSAETEGQKEMREVGTTGPDGRASVKIPYLRNVRGPFVRFEDKAGAYVPKDTVFLDLQPREILIELRK